MKHLILTAAILVCSISCKKTIDVNKSFDFDLQMMPVLTQVQADKPAEMRFTVRPIGGEYMHTKYYMRYFLYSGNGILMNEDGKTFFPNDEYLLAKKQFRLYYTPSQGSSHQLEIVIFDNFGHEKTMTITFTVSQTENTEIIKHC